jgi:dolichyl-phosphate-mannose-protein mannosyltransferase
VQAALLVATAWDKSDVGDEPTYLAAAALQWAHRDLDFNREAPALPKWGFAIGLRAVDPKVSQTPARRDWAATHVLWSRPTEEMRRNLFGARMATIVVTVLAGLCLWRAASRFGSGQAVVTHALWCLSPSILANGALATLDGWVTALLCVVILAAVRFCEAPGPSRATACGVAVGLAAACKVTALGVVPVLLAVGAMAWKERHPQEATGRRAALCAAAFFVGAVLALWVVYAFSVGTVTTATGRTWPLAPFPQWWAGLLQQWDVAAAGHSTYLFGEVRKAGWWWFYLAALALKTTLGAQALGLLRVAAWARRPPPWREWRVDAAILAYPALLLILLSVGRTQTGIRYLLPAFPFAMLWAGRGLVDAGRAFGAVGRVLVAAAVVAAAAESLAVHPHYLMFFNRWAGGPTGGPRYLILGDDWGQDQRRLGEWQNANRLPTIYYAEYSGMPSRWGINYKPAPCEPKVGVFALQAVEVHRPRRTDPGCLDWLTVEPPDERIGYSIYIYVVDRERLVRLAAEGATRRPFWRSGTPPP